jgi:hypothetical protein
MLTPCRFRNVTEDGQLVCARIAAGDCEVSPDICRACPVAAVNCRHLRASLAKRDGGGIIVRYGNGRSEVWPGEPAGVHMQRAACAAICLPVAGPEACAGCHLHSPASGADEREARRTSGSRDARTWQSGAGAGLAACATT